jgi:serine/threonine protein kinase
MEAIKTSIDRMIAGRYELTELLGEGGSGSTYRAIRSGDGEIVAVKMLSLRHLQDWKQLELFEREAQVLAQLHHPQIPQYLDYFHIDTPDNRAFYIVQQLAEGKPLNAWVESGWRGTEVEIKDIARQLLVILQYLHQHSPPLTHRDIKPQNIIRDDAGRVFLVDFGSVQHVYQNTILKSSTVAGTYGYMAPEQFRGAALPASDLYGLGATILYLLTHRSPADLPQERLKLSFRSHVNISQHFADWLDAMIEPAIEQRFSTAKAAANNLQNSRALPFKAKSTAPKSKSLWLATTAVSISLLAIYLLFSYRNNLLTLIGKQPVNLCSNRIDIQILTNYLNQGGNPNAQMAASSIEGDPMMPLLHCAILTNNSRAVTALLDSGADPNIHQFTNSGFKKSKLKHSSTLHQAIYASRNPELVKLLLDRGANPNLGDVFNNTPLHILIQRGNHERQHNYILMKLLIDRGADPNITNQSGDTPLHFLVKDYTSMPLKKCVRQNPTLSTEILELLAGKTKPIANKEGDTALHLFAEQGYLPQAQRLIKLGWNPLQANRQKKTAMQSIKLAEAKIQQCQARQQLASAAEKK